MSYIAEQTVPRCTSAIAPQLATWMYRAVGALASTVWTVLFARASDIYVGFILALWFYAEALWYPLSRLFRDRPPNPHCAGTADDALPVYSVYIFVVNVVVSLAHDIHWNNGILGNYRRVAMKVLSVAVVLAVPVITGNNTAVQVLGSAGIAVLIALVFCFLMFYRWTEQLSAVVDHPVLRFLGIGHDEIKQEQLVL